MTNDELKNTSIDLMDPFFPIPNSSFLIRHFATAQTNQKIILSLTKIG